MLNVKNMRIAVVGMARSGIAAAEYLTELGAKVSIYDMAPFIDIMDKAISLMDKGITVYCQTNEIELEETDLIIVSPGVDPKTPFFEEAKEMGIEIWSEIELAYRLSPCPILAVTGTNGKTTTCVMTGKILRADGRDYFIGGNVAGHKTDRITKQREGLPLIECVRKAEKNSVISAEISTFQLEQCHKFAPKAASLVNVGVDHLNRHGTVEVYRSLKAKIFAFQNKESYSVLNADDPFVESLKDKVGGTPLMFSVKKEVEEGCFLRNNEIILKIKGEETPIININEILVPGFHNVMNAMAAILMTWSVGVKPESMRKALSMFKGVSHRLEFVKTVDDVDYINNSMCTNVDAAAASAYALAKPQIVIAGGKDKGSDFTEFAKALKERAKAVVLIGIDRGMIEEKLRGLGYDNIEKAETLKEAVCKAKEKAVPGDCVVLTPGCASFDMFKSFEDRGEQFIEIVNGL
ncbi:MAG: UDP-N-acetylmuramoyl-L-alanine--D-glutamate ligase [Armatimonadetes bacterium]|nr:UDP-N-acetylmuramoyl-L-alanine--D-glutamate ligase [Candidatus Hippobium faecium]